MSKPDAIYTKLRDARDDNGVAWVQSKDVAKIIRRRLKAAFPGVKFSVRSDHNSINVRWTDGPHHKHVGRIAGQYEFGGFDGMIDLAYSTTNWMLPDGSCQPAASSGTEGSRGSVPGYATDCPAPGAILVKGGPEYVFCHQDNSDEAWQALADEVCRRYGHEPGQDPNTYHLFENFPNRLLREDMWRYANDKAEREIRRSEKPRLRLVAPGELVAVEQ